MKKLILIIILAITITLPTPTQSQSRKLITPSIPNQQTVAIVITKQVQTIQQIKQLLSPYKDIKLRRIFTEAIIGFSIEGSRQTIAKLAENNLILTISPVTSYQAQTEESVKIIGGEEVRGLFSPKNQRLTGKGITVGVIDTGVDYTHPDLRRNYGGGHDLVDNDRDPMETRATGKATIHGTHVAGIIAANGKIRGVAPDAKIIAYRALGPGGGGTTEQVIAAIDQAIKDKVDIMNLSLGNDVNGPDLPISLALNRAVDKGIVAVAANGNAGPDIWTVGSPGTASKAISVGASTPTLKIPSLLIEETREKIQIQPMEGSEKWELDRSYSIVYGGMGKKEELKNVEGKIVLIKRGRLTFTEKAKNAQAAGAKAVLIYNNMSGNFIGNLETLIPIPVGSVSKRNGERLLKNKTVARIIQNEEKDRMAEFSSRGPVTGTWEVKPDIVAPGVAINSTIPGGYLSLQGTSMAAPHVAGACALIKQAHPDWKPPQIKAALMNTAKPLFQTENKPYHTYEQGAGRIQVVEAIEAESLVTPSSLHFGKFTEEQAIHKTALHVENTSNITKRYSFDIPERTEGLTWKIPLSFTLKPKEMKEVAIELMVDPQNFKRKIHDGYITINAGSTPIHIPYIYVLEEPNYPRVMGFSFGEGDAPGQYLYEVYLPGGAEEFGIALFNPGDYRFMGFLDTIENVKKGLIQKKIDSEKLPEDGVYLAKVFAKKAGKEDFIETMVKIEKK
ncbi:peptidase S8 [Bacillus sp. MUM 116]|uniref:S8 family serine peptidase n=1 Tax=Bacillus sp. MUM 116 TaxID=1678002 RepID=UPI0008F5EB72|nr:S8 family serine peptidase [Bacillus sp. MUM 116]OIK16105.1 peptidase S8 [Bacillus sp. MUM 116]